MDKQPVPPLTPDIKDKLVELGNDLAGTRDRALVTLRENNYFCRDCPLVEKDPKMYPDPVDGGGSTFPDIAVIGEAPGKVALEQGAPFVGVDGAAMEEMFRLCGYNPTADLWVTYAAMCRSPGKTAVQTVASCRPRLFKELQIVDPAGIVCLGKIAAQALGIPIDSVDQGFCNTYTVQLPGKYVPYQVPALVLYHPAFYLRLGNYWRNPMFLRQVYTLYQFIISIDAALGRTVIRSEPEYPHALETELKESLADAAFDY